MFGMYANLLTEYAPYLLASAALALRVQRFVRPRRRAAA
jgi:hypothetical protein